MKNRKANKRLTSFSLLDESSDQMIAVSVFLLPNTNSNSKALIGKLFKVKVHN